MKKGFKKYVVIISILLAILLCTNNVNASQNFIFKSGNQVTNTVKNNTVNTTNKTMNTIKPETPKAKEKMPNTGEGEVFIMGMIALTAIVLGVGAFIKSKQNEEK